MADIKNLNKETTPEAYTPNESEVELGEFLKKRVAVLYETKKDIIGGLDFSEIMRAADREYQPDRFLETNRDTQKFLVEDELNGLRGSRLTTLPSTDGTNWRSNVSEPTLLVKLQTALSILIDQNPEGIFKATTEKFEARNNVAKALWKRNWELNDSLETLKLFVFDLAKYGFAVGHTLPRIIKRDKKILKEVDPEDSSKNKYEDSEIVEFNDVYREKLDLYRTWIDDKANLSDRFSVNDWYYEKDFAEDDFKREFGHLKHSKAVKFAPLPKTGERGDSSDTRTDKGSQSNLIRQNMVTVGFYENKAKDLYSVYIPQQNIVLDNSPLPNDDGKLTLWWAYWLERDARTIYGIGLFELIKANKVIYDRFKNMTVDQLVMAIYPMLFYTGKPMDGESKFVISPNQIIPKAAGTTIDQIKIAYDGRGWDGVERIAQDIDNVSGITPTLQGAVEGETATETLHAKDSALRRLNIPLINIAHAIEEDAYITLSWMKQIYSIPEVKEFVNLRELEDYEEEQGITAESVSGETGLLGGFNGKVEGEFLPQLDLGLGEDRDGILEESPERRFFQLGKEGNLPLEALRWEGKISIKARSVVSPSPELEKQSKLELYNLVFPAVQAMAQAMSLGETDMALALYKPVNEILEIHDEEPIDWLPDKLVELAESPELREATEKAQQKAQNPLFVKPGQEGQGGGQPQGGSAQSIAPRNEVTNPLRKMLGNIKSNNTKAQQG